MSHKGSLTLKVLSSCRLLTEAQAALDRSIRDFVTITESFDSDPDPLDTTSIDNRHSARTDTIINNKPNDHNTETRHASLDTTDVAKKSSTVNNEVGPVKRQKKPRDPDMPKRPVPAFFLYQKEKRGSTKASLPDEAKPVDVQKALGEQWQGLDEIARRPYLDRYEQDLKKYEMQMAAYNQEKGILPTIKSVKDGQAQATPADTTPRIPHNEDDEAAAASLALPITAIASTDPPKAAKKRIRKTIADPVKDVRQQSEQSSTDKEKK